MSAKRLPLSLVALALVLTACTSRTVPTPAGSGTTQTMVVTQPIPGEITQGSPSPGATSTATASSSPAPTSTPGAPPLPAEGTTTPTPPPIDGPDSPQIPTQPAPSPGPTQPGTEIPWLEWEGPGFVYIKDFSELMISSFDGSQKSVLASLPDVGAWIPSFSPETGRVVVGSSHAVWVVDPGKDPQAILELDQDEYIESPVITRDGTKIAYSLVKSFGDEGIQELWTINPDGTENTLAIDDTGQTITDPGPFRLRPKAWSSDNTRVYLITTSDSEATPKGMYVADLATGTIAKALTPPVTLWDLSFSPDRSQIAYRTFQWKPVPGSRPEEGPPFTLNVTDLTTGETRIVLESETDQYFHPIWSQGGNRLAYSVRPGVMEADAGLFTINLMNGEVRELIPGSASSRLMPWYWLPEDSLLFAEGDLSSGNMFVYADSDVFSGNRWNTAATLYTVNLAGTEKDAIDSGGIVVLGVIDH